MAWQPNRFIAVKKLKSSNEIRFEMNCEPLFYWIFSKFTHEDSSTLITGWSKSMESNLFQNGKHLCKTVPFDVWSCMLWWPWLYALNCHKYRTNYYPTTQMKVRHSAKQTYIGCINVKASKKMLKNLQTQRIVFSESLVKNLLMTSKIQQKNKIAFAHDFNTSKNTRIKFPHWQSNLKHPVAISYTINLSSFELQLCYDMNHCIFSIFSNHKDVW